MKSVMIMMAAASVLALAACGGGSGENNSSRADEGIWSNFSDAAAANMMETVILSDGSYWGILGQNFGSSATPAPALGPVCMSTILHGTASINGNDVSGVYTDFPDKNGSYSGTVSGQNSLDLIFNDSSNPILAGAGGNFNLGYDSSYSQSASLSEIAGSYHSDQLKMGCMSTGIASPVDSNSEKMPVGSNLDTILTISGSNLSLSDQDGNLIMTGTITPYGKTASVFNIDLTAATTVAGYRPGFVSSNITAGTNYKGILFQTSSGIFKNDIQMIGAAENSAFFFAGGKQN